MHLVLTTLAGDEVQLTIEIQEFDRLQEFENAIMEQLPVMVKAAPLGANQALFVATRCCALLQIRTTHDATNQLTPQAELMPRAFRKCTALRQINFELTEHQPNGRTRCLPECCFMEAGLTALTLPPEFNWMGPSACERCMQLQLVDLSRTEIIEIMGGTFAHCKHLQTLKLPGALRMIRQEAFLKCASLTEVHVPPTLLYIARRAFAGCTQLCPKNSG